MVTRFSFVPLFSTTLSWCRSTFAGRFTLLAIASGGFLGVVTCGARTVETRGPNGVTAVRTEGNEPSGEATNAVLRLPEAPPPLLHGARCRDLACSCRVPGKDDRETSPPDANAKRIEIRISSGGGQAVLASSTLGRFETSGTAERCFYTDLVPGTRHDLVFLSTEESAGHGVSPHLEINEYGPVGPWWYATLDVSCGGGGLCDRDAADEWIAKQRSVKRGRVDPCGSLVVSRVHWQSSGGQAERDGGKFRDFGVSFSLDVKRFATQFAPGATECVPK